MSWADYLNNLTKEGLTGAAICGLDGADWVQITESSNISQAELKAVLEAMGQVDTLASTGIRIGGEKYLYISGSDSVCRGKKGAGGIHMAKSKTTLVLGIYDKSLQPGQAANIVEKMAEFLSEKNY